jgi:uncharacterized membrane protein required for colicin V production
MMPINFFDCLLVAILAFGLIRGRRNGLSHEALRSCRWVVLLLGCAAVYKPAGDFISAAGFFDGVSSYLLAYLGAALVLFFMFSILQRRLHPKLAGTDAFGRGEYYLGMGAGLVRYICMLLIGLALLNARQFTPAEIKAGEKSQLDSYGSTIFPTLRTVQEAVFEESLIGPCIRTHLAFLLIQPTEAKPVEPSGSVAVRARGPR